MGCVTLDTATKVAEEALAACKSRQQRDFERQNPSALQLRQEQQRSSSSSSS
jgi:hypothetical protein